MAGELLLERYGGPAEGVSSKSSDTDLVSEADRASEAAILDLLTRERPDDGLLGEEGASREGASGRRWVVDPLDGTINYLYRFPAWCVSVALEDADGGLVGVVHDPLRGEMFTASRGGGASLNGVRVEVNAKESLDLALVATGFAYQAEMRAVQADRLTEVLPRVRDIRRAGAAALDLAWVAAGRLDAYYERGLKHWDWAAARVLITEAGGALAELEGEPRGLAAANPMLLPKLLELLATVVYHVSSTLNRSSIAEHGLDWERMRDVPGVAGSPTPERPGVFLAEDLHMADWFVQMSRSNHQSVDIWEVTLPHDFDAYEEDLPAGLPYDRMDGHLYTTERVPPDRVRLLKTDL
jgi:myo-inositol-1(or 4)-monophosphatase